MNASDANYARMRLCERAMMDACDATADNSPGVAIAATISLLVAMLGAAMALNAGESARAFIGTLRKALDRLEGLQ